MSVQICFFLFYIYAIIGWMIEVINTIICNKKFINRGFMIGPYCPIYGIGGLVITLSLQRYTQNPFVLFCVAIVICGVLEYATSYVMEKIFKARWWDYSKRKFNINGRVCLETIIPFGLLGCFVMYISNPFFINILEKIPSNILNIMFYIFLSTFILDFMISFFVISRLRKTVKNVNKENVYDNTEEITEKVKEILRGKSIFDRRLIDAFPKISIEQVKKKIKEKTELVKENVAKVKEETTEKIKESAEKVKSSTIKIKEDATEIIKEKATKIKQTTMNAKEKIYDESKEEIKELNKKEKSE